MRFVFFVFTLSSLMLSVKLNAQNAAYKIRTYEFKDGVYRNSASLYANQPEITEFTIKKAEQGNEIYTIYQPCPDSSDQKKICEITDAWGFVYQKNLYLAVSVGGFFRAQIVGALVHFIDVESILVEHTPNFSSSPYYYSNFNYDMPTYSRRNTASEYIINIVTGEKIFFTYRNFRNFLKRKDTELYNELIHSKQKRKLIYFFLMKYNDRHPLSIPYSE